MLQNLTEDKRKTAAYHRAIRDHNKYWHQRIQRIGYRLSFSWCNRKIRPIKFSERFTRYIPNENNYAQDTLTDFTGVYVSTYGCCWPYTEIDDFTKQRITTPSQDDILSVMCDSASQAINFYNEVTSNLDAVETKYQDAQTFCCDPEHLKGNHVCIMHKLETDGLRWHKWSEYIGDADISNAYYASDVPGMKQVYCAQFYKIH